jgi:hypothetical protein
MRATTFIANPAAGSACTKRSLTKRVGPRNRGVHLVTRVEQILDRLWGWRAGPRPASSVRVTTRVASRADRGPRHQGPRSKKEESTLLRTKRVEWRYAPHQRPSPEVPRGAARLQRRSMNREPTGVTCWAPLPARRGAAQSTSAIGGTTSGDANLSSWRSGSRRRDRRAVRGGGPECCHHPRTVKDGWLR